MHLRAFPHARAWRSSGRWRTTSPSGWRYGCALVFPERAPERLIERLEDVLEHRAFPRRRHDLRGQARTQLPRAVAGFGQIAELLRRHDDMREEVGLAGTIVGEAVSRNIAHAAVQDRQV